MPLDQAQWQIDILAADKTAAAFASVGRRMRDMERAFTAGARQQASQVQAIVDSVVKASIDPTAIVKRQAEGYAALAASQTLLGKVNAQAIQQFGALRVQTDTGARSLTGFGAASAAAAAGGGGLVAMVARLSPILGPVAAAWATWQAGMKAGALVDQAEQIGLTVEQLQAYRFAALQIGVSNQELDSSVLALTRAMGAANAGSDATIAKFDKLGVKLLDSKGELRGVADVMPEVARGLLSVGSETERSALSQELFGKSGARMLTLLGDMAKGSEALVDSARQHKVVVGVDVADAWNKLDTQLKITATTADAALAALGAPIATAAMEAVDRLLKSILGNLDRLKELERTAPQRAVGADISNLGDQLAAARQRQAQFRPGSTGYNMEKASIEAIERRIAASRQDLLALDVAAQESGERHGKLPAMVPPPGTTGTGGSGQPTGNAAAKAGASAAESLAKKQREESERVYAQLLADIEKVRKAGEALTDRLGNGMETATRKTDELNEMMAQGAIDSDVYEAALREINRAAEDQNRAFIGAKGGFDAYIAGFDQGIADMARANSEFEIGRKAVDFLGDSIEALAGISGKSFEEIAINFALMIAKMEAARAASQVWSSLGGFSGILASLGLGGGDALAGIGNTAAEAAVNAFGPVLMSAGGGPLRAGQPSVIGEIGPEVFVPNTGGNVLNRQQLQALGVGGGGGSVVNVYQTVYVGQYVTQTEYRQGLVAVERSAREGAHQGIIAAGRAGDPRLREALS